MSLIATEGATLRTRAATEEVRFRIGCCGRKGRNGDRNGGLDRYLGQLVSLTRRLGWLRSNVVGLI